MTLKNKLWVECYRPKTVEDYVFVDEKHKQQVLDWIKQESIPNLILSGEAGVGKTSLAKLLINEFEINDYDVLEVNASRDNGVDLIREKVLGFVQTVPFSKFKVVLLDEADYLTPNGQAMLRNDIETYHDTTRFILTCNYQHRIIPALKSRCHLIHITKTDITEFTARVATILVKENIDFDLEVLDDYVNNTYPDLRKCINQIQVNSSSGKLLNYDNTTSTEEDLLAEATILFKQKDIVNGRKKVIEYLTFYPNKAEDIYKWAYDNLDIWGDTQEKKDASIVIIRNGLVNLNFVAIPEIAVSASIVELLS